MYNEVLNSFNTLNCSIVNVNSIEGVCPHGQRQTVSHTGIWTMPDGTLR